MNVANNFNSNFFASHRFRHKDFIITSGSSLNSFQVTLLTLRLKFNFKTFLEVHILVDKNLSHFLICTLSYCQSQLIRMLVPILWRIFTTNCICIRMSKSLYFFVLKFSFRVVKRLHLRWMSRRCWISVVFELPIIPTGQMLFSHFHYIFYFCHVISLICNTSKLSDWESNIKLLCVFMPHFSVLMVKKLAFIWSVWISEWTVSMITDNIKSFKWLLTWWIVKSSQNIGNAWFKE